MSSTPTSPAALPFRIGHGYDLHRLDPRPPAGHGKPLVVGGITLEHDLGPIAHSDGDALLHAITDALLGAIAQPDIGQLFPNTDPRHDSQDSAVFLIEAIRRVRAAGFEVLNLDSTVILEEPKLGPVKEQIRERIAELLGLALSQVNLKGKTHEGVDAVGEGRAIETHAVVLLVRTRA